MMSAPFDFDADVVPAAGFDAIGDEASEWHLAPIDGLLDGGARIAPTSEIPPDIIAVISGVDKDQEPFVAAVLSWP